jgi:thiamine pyrophosphate-dependent acetolactate synthase large subunit-like protein
MQMSRTVAGTLVDALEKVGVRQIFGLIGDSLNPIADAVRHSNIEWIGVRHEEGAALAAAGQAKLTGRLGVCCGTTGPGSTHLVAGLLRDVIDKALKADCPAIVDCVVAANELPNFPHVEPEQAGNYAKAKIKETILAVSGG